MLIFLKNKKFENAGILKIQLAIKPSRIIQNTQNQIYFSIEYFSLSNKTSFMAPRQFYKKCIQSHQRISKNSNISKVNFFYFSRYWAEILNRTPGAQNGTLYKKSAHLDHTLFVFEKIYFEHFNGFPKIKISSK
jgi:hypothetical protein